MQAKLASNADRRVTRQARVGLAVEDDLELRLGPGGECPYFVHFYLIFSLVLLQCFLVYLENGLAWEALQFSFDLAVWV